MVTPSQPVPLSRVSSESWYWDDIYRECRREGPAVCGYCAGLAFCSEGRVWVEAGVWLVCCGCEEWDSLAYGTFTLCAGGMQERAKHLEQKKEERRWNGSIWKLKRKKGSVWLENTRLNVMRKSKLNRGQLWVLYQGEGMWTWSRRHGPPWEEQWGGWTSAALLETQLQTKMH